MLLSAAGGAIASEVTFAPADGYDDKRGNTLVQDGKLYVVQSSENDWFQVEAGHWLSLRFFGHYALASDSRREAANSTTYGVLKLTLRATGYDWQFLPVAGGTFGDSASGIYD